MSYCFTIDNREHKLITLFQKMQFPIQIKALDIGDIIDDRLKKQNEGIVL